MTENMKKAIVKILSDKNLQERLIALNSEDEIYEFFVEIGGKIEKKEFESEMQKMKNKKEVLNEEDLKEVSGGNKILTKATALVLGSLMLGNLSAPQTKALGFSDVIKPETIKSENIGKVAALTSVGAATLLTLITVGGGAAALGSYIKKSHDENKNREDLISNIKSRIASEISNAESKYAISVANKILNFVVSNKDSKDQKVQELGKKVDEYVRIKMQSKNSFDDEDKTNAEDMISTCMKKDDDWKALPTGLLVELAGLNAGYGTKKYGDEIDEEEQRRLEQERLEQERLEQERIKKVQQQIEKIKIRVKSAENEPKNMYAINVANKILDYVRGSTDSKIKEFKESRLDGYMSSSIMEGKTSFNGMKNTAEDFLTQYILNNEFQILPLGFLEDLANLPAEYDKEDKIVVEGDDDDKIRNFNDMFESYSGEGITNGKSAEVFNNMIKFAALTNIDLDKEGLGKYKKFFQEGNELYDIMAELDDGDISKIFSGKFFENLSKYTDKEKNTFIPAFIRLYDAVSKAKKEGDISVFTRAIKELRIQLFYSGAGYNITDEKIKNYYIDGGNTNRTIAKAERLLLNLEILTSVEPTRLKVIVDNAIIPNLKSDDKIEKEKLIKFIDGIKNTKNKYEKDMKVKILCGDGKNNQNPANGLIGNNNKLCKWNNLIYSYICDLPPEFGGKYIGNLEEALCKNQLQSFYVLNDNDLVEKTFFQVLMEEKKKNKFDLYSLFESQLKGISITSYKKNSDGPHNLIKIPRGLGNYGCRCYYNSLTQLLSLIPELQYNETVEDGMERIKAIAKSNVQNEIPNEIIGGLEKYSRLCNDICAKVGKLIYGKTNDKYLKLVEDKKSGMIRINEYNGYKSEVNIFTGFVREINSCEYTYRKIGSEFISCLEKIDEFVGGLDSDDKKIQKLLEFLNKLLKANNGCKELSEKDSKELSENLKNYIEYDKQRKDLSLKRDLFDYSNQACSKEIDEFDEQKDLYRHFFRHLNKVNDDEYNTGNPMEKDENTEVLKCLDELNEGSIKGKFASNQMDVSEAFYKLKLPAGFIRTQKISLKDIPVANRKDVIQKSFNKDTFKFNSKYTLVNIDRAHFDKYRIDDKVNIPEEIQDCTGKKQKIMGISMHDSFGGGIDSGHYWANVKKNGKWYYCDDGTVEENKVNLANGDWGQGAVMILYGPAE